MAAVVATAVAGLASTTGLGFGAVGALAIGAGLATGGRTFVDVGAVAVFFGVVVAGLEATVVGPTVFGTIAVVLAWDLAHTAIDIGEQLGRETQTRRLEAVAIVSSLLVGLLAGAIGYAVFIAGAGGQPVAMVVLLLLAAALITIGLGKRDSSRDASALGIRNDHAATKIGRETTRRGVRLPRIPRYTCR